jgi:translation elongation factor EF-Tu-like GTPase
VNTEVSVTAVDVVDVGVDDDGVLAAEVLVLVALEVEDLLGRDQVEGQLDPVVGLERRAL